MTAAELKLMLRADLKSAMQNRASGEVRLLRALIAALDNAEAVPAESAGDNPATEVPRLELDWRAVSEVLAREQKERLAAASDYEARGQEASAATLRGEAALIARYAAIEPS